MTTCLGGEVGTCHWGSRGPPLLTAVVTATLLGVIHPPAQREALLSRYCPGREFRNTRFQAWHNPDCRVFAVSPHIPGLSFCPYIRGVVLDGGFQPWLPLNHQGSFGKIPVLRPHFSPIKLESLGWGLELIFLKKPCQVILLCSQAWASLGEVAGLWAVPLRQGGKLVPWALGPLHSQTGQLGSTDSGFLLEV